MLLLKCLRGNRNLAENENKGDYSLNDILVKYQRMTIIDCDSCISSFLINIKVMSHGFISID